MLVADLIREGYARGYEMTFGEAYRTPEQAVWNAKHGQGIEHSLHMVRLAIDLMLFRDGVYLTHSDDYRSLGEWWKAQSTTELVCAWGGDFQSKDGNHFSIEHEGRR